MPRTIHLCLSVRGALSWPKSEWWKALKWITKDDGTPFGSIDELRDAFMEELSKGHEVLPMSKACDDFDFKTGCRGHEQPSAPEIANA